MEGKFLEQVITVNCSDIKKTLLEYFSLKQKKYLPVSDKSIISRDAIKVLFCEVIKSNEFVKWAIACLEEFTSNKTIKGEWQEFYEDLSELVKACVFCICDVHECKAYLKDICYIIFILGEKGDPLSSALFNACAKKLLTFLLHGSIGNFEERILLTSISTLSRFSEPSRIAVAYNTMKKTLSFLTKKIFALPIESQISVFFLLSKSFSSRDDALEKASIWFLQWPSLQKSLTDYFPLKLDEGSSQFLTEIFLIKSKYEGIEKRIFDIEDCEMKYSGQRVLPPQCPSSPRFTLHETSLERKRLSSSLVNEEEDYKWGLPRPKRVKPLFRRDARGKIHYIPRGPPKERWTSFKRLKTKDIRIH